MLCVVCHICSVGNYNNNLIYPINNCKSYRYKIQIYIFQVLTELWVPSVNYQFPLLEKYKKRGLKFQFKWLYEFNWLAYSEFKQGAFCKFCLLFAKGDGVGSQPLGQLVTSAFTNWKKAKEVGINKFIKIC